MQRAVYAISPTLFGWVICHHNDVSQLYETADAALEAACAEASAQLEQGLDATVTIDVGRNPSRAYDRPVGRPVTRSGEAPVMMCR